MKGVAALMALANHDHPPSGLMPPVRPDAPTGFGGIRGLRPLQEP